MVESSLPVPRTLGREPSDVVNLNSDSDPGASLFSASDVGLKGMFRIKTRLRESDTLSHFESITGRILFRKTPV